MLHCDIKIGGYYYFDEGRRSRHGFDDRGIVEITCNSHATTGPPGSPMHAVAEEDGFRGNCWFFADDTTDFDYANDDYFIFPDELVRPATDLEKKLFLLETIH